ncbi:hypothetical protein [Tateyamaria sp. SN6-1]|uniref:class III lanthionine synthetase LanKC N-terminal domain-containing protein n=1 Tax=Tateyamaria sp. SN6-1 TaxID=3092148 RepID=UPI0039F63776
MPDKDPQNGTTDDGADVFADMFGDDPEFVAQLNGMETDKTKFNQQLFKKNRDKIAEKLVRTVYYSKSFLSDEFEHDWLIPANGGIMTKTSCFSKPRAPGQWYKTDLEPYGHAGSVQGWKMHVGCHPLDLISFFTTIAPLLNKHKIMHKFHSFATQYGHEVGHNVAYEKGEGKTCVIYPDDPRHLVRIVNLVEAEIIRANARYMADTSGTVGPAFRPYPGGVPGTMNVGRTGFIGVRYGGFVGPLPDHSQLFDVRKLEVVRDPRGRNPYPDFITSVPTEILHIKAR